MTALPLFTLQRQLRGNKGVYKHVPDFRKIFTMFVLEILKTDKDMYTRNN